MRSWAQRERVYAEGMKEGMPSMSSTEPRDVVGWPPEEPEVIKISMVSVSDGVTEAAVVMPRFHPLLEVSVGELGWPRREAVPLAP